MANASAGRLRSRIVVAAALGAAVSISAASGAIAGGAYKLGAPYEADGIWYVPAEDPSYDATGTAARYGDGLDGRATANGERFDARALTGAHATLPMPCIVEVTNLDNGRVLRVRLNDRGAAAPGRLIDLTPAAADRLGVSADGSAKVRVRYVAPARLEDGLEPQVPAPPPEPPRPAPDPWSAPAVVAREDGFLVQAGAFSDQGRAERVAASLAAAGKPLVRPVEVGGRTLYRVLVGSWRGAEAADRARAEIAALGFADARVVRAF